MYLKGCFIAHKGELGENMYFLVAGEACASMNDKILKKYAVGSYFGELSLLLTDHPRSCDLVCLSHVELENWIVIALRILLMIIQK